SVFVFDKKRNFQDIELSFFLLARLVHCQSKAFHLLEEWKKRLNRIRKITITLKYKPKVFMVIWPKPLTSCGPGSFHHEIIEDSGGRNIISSLSRYPRVSREEVLSQNPDFIFILAHDKGNPKTFWTSFSQLKAVKKKHIFILPDRFAIPLPSYYVEAVEWIYRKLNRNPNNKKRN
ncbi:MAG: ABC transporter substrate-binding protein, partial [Planctomycetota bacterium]